MTSAECPSTTEELMEPKGATYLLADFERYDVTGSVCRRFLSSLHLRTNMFFTREIAQLTLWTQFYSNMSESSSAYMCRSRSSRRPAVFTDARVASARISPSCSVTVAAFLRQSCNKAAERGTRPAAAAYQPDLVDGM